ncbi:MAG: transporter substrate-binding domain-containing protein [Leptospirales bacterium]|jgi:membrane-bound lytic murein transglycosylase MltF
MRPSRIPIRTPRPPLCGFLQRARGLRLALLLTFALSLSAGGPRCIAVYEAITAIDIEDIRERGKLKVITSYGANSYFIYRGQPMGYEYELLERLADDLGVELEIVVTRDMDNIVYMLNSGLGDLVASNLVVTRRRANEVTFTEHLMTTRQVLVQRRPDYRPAPPINTAEETPEKAPVEIPAEKPVQALAENPVKDSVANSVGAALENPDRDPSAATENPPELTAGQKSAQAEQAVTSPDNATGGAPPPTQSVETAKIPEPLKLIRDPIDLIGKTIHVRGGSAFYERLRNLEDEIGGDIRIETVPGDVTTEELIRRVHAGEIDYTVADEPTALINRGYYAGLDVETSVSFPQRIAWVVRGNSPQLREAINAWILRVQNNGDLTTLYNKYYRNDRAFRERVDSEFYLAAEDPANLASNADTAANTDGAAQDADETQNKISIFDDRIREAARSIGWDWRLLASLIYQESRFNPRARSWAGAAGLMQLMPETGRQYGLRNFYEPDENIRAGAAHLKWLGTRWEPEIKDPDERLKFILASYNAGSGHVEDARILARLHKRDPDRWEETAPFLLKLADPEYYNLPEIQHGYCRGEEPFLYVKEILSRSEQYRKFIAPDQAPVETKGHGQGDADV